MTSLFEKLKVRVELKTKVKPTTKLTTSFQNAWEEREKHHNGDGIRI
jgi:hypothetical protein